MFQRTCIQNNQYVIVLSQDGLLRAPVPVCPQFPTSDLELGKNLSPPHCPPRGKHPRPETSQCPLGSGRMCCLAFVQLSKWVVWVLFVLFSGDLLWCKFTYHVSFRCTMSQSDVCTYCEMITPEVHLTQSQNIFLKIYSSSNFQRCSTVLLISGCCTVHFIPRTDL